MRILLNCTISISKAVHTFYNYYFIKNIEITLDMHGENLMAIKCIIMFRFILGLKLTKFRFLSDHSPNPTDALSQDQVI